MAVLLRKREWVGQRTVARFGRKFTKEPAQQSCKIKVIHLVPGVKTSLALEKINYISFVKLSSCWTR